MDLATVEFDEDGSATIYVSAVLRDYLVAHPELPSEGGRVAIEGKRVDQTWVELAGADYGPVELCRCVRVD